MRRRDAPITLQQPLVTSGQRNDLKIFRQGQQALEHLFAAGNPRATGHEQQSGLVRRDAKLAGALDAVQLPRKRGHDRNSADAHVRMRDATPRHAKSNLVVRREVAAHARLHPHTMQIKIGDLNPYGRHRTFSLDLMRQQLSR
jgi:hypothetical protein